MKKQKADDSFTVVTVHQASDAQDLRSALPPKRTLRLQPHEIKLLSVHQMVEVKLIINIVWHCVRLFFQKIHARE